MRYHCYLFVAILILLWIPIAAQDMATNEQLAPALEYHVQEAFDTQELPPLKWILEEGENSLTFEELRQGQLKDAKFLDLREDAQFDIKAHQNYWFRILISSDLESSLDHFALRLDRVGNCWPWEFTFKQVNSYSLDQQGRLMEGKSGSIFNANQRDYPNIIDPSLIQLRLAQGEVLDRWVRLSMAEGCTMKVNLALVDETVVYSDKEWSLYNILYMLALGAGIMLFIVTVFLYILFREKVFLWFFIFQCIWIISGIGQVFQNELFAQFFLYHPRLLLILRTFWDVGRFAIFIHFARVLINTKSKFPSIHKALGWAIIFVISLCFLGVFTRSYPSFLTIIWATIRPFLVICFLSTTLGAFVYLLFSKDKLARFFLMGVILPYFVTFIALLTLNLHNDLKTVKYVVLFNGLAMVLTMTLALVYRFRRIIIRRLELQNELKFEHLEAQRLKELDGFKSRLYTNLTHEFRTPLTVILGMADQLNSTDKAKSTQGAELIKRNANQLLDIIYQLLDLSKLEDKSFKLQLQQDDIVYYLRYITESFQTYANSKNLSLRFFSSIESQVMDYDAKQVHQLLHNLISNAIKFTPSAGTISIKLSLHNEQLQIEVIDSGIGIAEKDLSRVFDRFYQADNENSRQGKGSGIGLAHCKELVNLMEGSIVVNSKLGEGTTFSISLPINNNAPLIKTALENEKLSTTIFQDTENTKVLANGHKTTKKELPHLLIIEDNADVVIYLQNCLEPYYQLDVAYNGRIGIEKAQEHIPDLIISDLMMPEKDGYEVCDTLKNDERTSHIPIILLTAKADAASKISGLRHGADAYLAKPFHKEELLVRLEKLVERQQRLVAYFSKNIQSENSIDTPDPALQEAIEVEDVFIQKVRQIVAEHHGDENFGLPQLCQKIRMSRSQLFRKMKALINTSPSQFIRNYRLSEAKSLLENSDLNVSEVAWQVGFKDPSHFSKAFQDKFGVSPSATNK